MKFFMSFLLYFPPPKSLSSKDIDGRDDDMDAGGLSLSEEVTPVTGLLEVELLEVELVAAAEEAEGAEEGTGAAAGATGLASGSEGDVVVELVGEVVGDEDDASPLPEKMSISFDEYTDSLYFSNAVLASDTLSTKTHLHATHDLVGRASKYFF